MVYDFDVYGVLWVVVELSNIGVEWFEFDVLWLLFFFFVCVMELFDFIGCWLSECCL